MPPAISPTTSLPPSSPETNLTNPPIPPSLLDILPPLHDLLSRLLLPSPPKSSQQEFTPLNAVSPTNITAAGSVASPSIPNSNDPSAPLAIKDLATAAGSIKLRIEKAREYATKGMIEGGDMSIEQQEVLIVALEEEVRRLKGIMEEMGRAGKEAARELDRRKEKEQDSAESMEV